MYAYSYPLHILDSGIATRGDGIRISAVMQRLRSGMPITAVAYGTSITASGGCMRDCRHERGWYSRLFDWMNSTYPHKDHRFVNLGKRGGGLNNVDHCLRTLAPRKVDLFFTEWAVAEPPSDAMERNIRTILKPYEYGDDLPALLLVHTFHWCRNRPYCNQVNHSSLMGTYTRSGEDSANVLAQYYGIPSVSLRNAFYHILASGRDRLSGNAYTLSDHILKGDMGVHLNRRGQTLLSDILIRYFQTLNDYELTTHERDLSHNEALFGLPGPLHGANGMARSALVCGNFFRAETNLSRLVVSSVGWRYTSTEPHSRLGRAFKPGLETKTPMSQVLFKFNSLCTRCERIHFNINHIGSYENFGDAVVECVSGCDCTRKLLKGVISKDRGSIEIGSSLQIGSSSECKVMVTYVGPHSKRFKITSVYVNSR